MQSNGRRRRRKDFCSHQLFHFLKLIWKRAWHEQYAPAHIFRVYASYTYIYVIAFKWNGECNWVMVFVERAHIHPHTQANSMLKGMVNIPVQFVTSNDFDLQINQQLAPAGANKLSQRLTGLYQRELKWRKQFTEGTHIE